MERLDYGPVEPAERPGTMIVFMHAANIQLRGITLRASPNWTLHLQDVSGAVISGIQILNDPRVPNHDGIDCMMWRDVRVSDCDIQTGDDDFAIVNSEHMNVSNCSMTSRSAAIRLESTKLSTFTGLSMDTNRGIAVFASARAAQPTEDIVFADIVMRTRLIPGHWWGKAEPIYIAVQPCAGGEACGVKVHNVSFTNITAEAESGALLWGGAGSAISGVDLDGVPLHMVAPNPEFSASVGAIWICGGRPQAPRRELRAARFLGSTRTSRGAAAERRARRLGGGNAGVFFGWGEGGEFSEPDDR